MTSLKSYVRGVLARSGYLVTRINAEDMRYLVPSYDASRDLPGGAEEVLRLDNPRLAELRQAYSRVKGPAAVPTQWNDDFLSKNLSLAWFRGDNAYVWQLRVFRDSARTRMFLSLLDVESRDRLGLMGKLVEDGLFGAYAFTFGDRAPVSRDVLDSVNEINYLEEQVGLSSMEGLRVLDIGAGYGRLAHRMAEALPNLATYHCADAVAVSTFLCEYYINFRGIGDRARVLELPDIERDGLPQTYDVAVNIHSFSECSRSAVRWWLERLSERAVPWLLIVPNTPGKLISTESDGTREDFLPDVIAAGYEVADRRPLYGSDELREMIGTEDEFVLFRRRG